MKCVFWTCFLQNRSPCRLEAQYAVSHTDTIHEEEMIANIPRRLFNRRLRLVKHHLFSTQKKAQFIHFAVNVQLHAPCSRGSTEN